MTRKAIAIHDDPKHSLNDDLFTVAKTASHEAAKLFHGAKFKLIASSLHYDTVNNCYTVLVEVEERKRQTFAEVMEQARPLEAPLLSH
jgi:hypothetical protein